MKLAPIAFAALACAFAAGCRTTKDVLDDCERNFSAGNYSGSTAELVDMADKRDGTQLLWRLLAANTLHLTDSCEDDAIRQFDLAEAVLQKNDQMSVFAQGGEGALAMMTNDRAFSYDGGGLDRIFTCVYRGIDFLCLGNSDNARVEFNRAAQYQRNWLYDRRRDIAAAEKKMASDAAAYMKQKNVKNVNVGKSVNVAMSDTSFGTKIRSKTGFDPATSGRLETLPQSAYVNAYAAHLAGVFRWLNGDNALDDLKLAAAVKPHDALLSRDFAECDKGMRPSNQVWIWVEDGLCPKREEWRLDLPLVFIPYANRYVQYAGMALPYLCDRACGASSWSVMTGGRTSHMQELESVDRLMRAEYDVYMRGALVREITRTVVRVGVQVGLGIAIDNTKDDRTKTALRITQYGVAVWSAANTAADIRSWTGLPKRVMAMRVDRPADGRVVISGDGMPVAEIQVPKGNSLVFVRKTSSAAPAVVKTVTFPN